MTSAKTTTCGEVLVQLLQDYGIEIVFGIPGVHTVELYRGLPNTRLRHITPRHEQGAGFMADGYARASGKPAACFIISGPGMTNIITAPKPHKTPSKHYSSTCRHRPEIRVLQSA